MAAPSGHRWTRSIERTSHEHSDHPGAAAAPEPESGSAPPRGPPRNGRTPNGRTTTTTDRHDWRRCTEPSDEIDCSAPARRSTPARIPDPHRQHGPAHHRHRNRVSWIITVIHETCCSTTDYMDHGSRGQASHEPRSVATVLRRHVPQRVRSDRLRGPPLGTRLPPNGHQPAHSSRHGRTCSATNRSPTAAVRTTWG